MTAQIKITYPDAPAVPLSRLQLGDFFSFPFQTATCKAYVVIWLDCYKDGHVKQMRYRALDNGVAHTGVDLDIRVTPLRLKSVEFEVRP